MSHEAEVLKVINSISDWKDMPPHYLSGMRGLTENNEWGIALENLCDNIYEFNVVVTDEVFIEIKRLCKMGRLEDSKWKFLEPLISKSSLQVT